MQHLRFFSFILFYLFANGLSGQTNLSQIDALLRDGNSTEAIELIKSLKEKNPTEKEELNVSAVEILALLQNNQLQQAKRILDKIEGEKNKWKDKSPNTYARIHIAHAAILRAEKKFDQEKSELHKAAYTINHSEVDPLVTNQIYGRLARSYRNEKNQDSTIIVADDGLAFLDKIKNTSEKNKAKISLINEKAMVFHSTSQSSKARPYFLDLVDLLKTEKDSAQLTNIYTNIAFGHFYAGEYGECKSYVEKSMAINIAKYGPNSQQALDSYQRIAVSLTKLQNYEDANIYYEKAHDIIKELKGEESLEIARLHFNIAVGHFQKNDFDLAIKKFEKSLNIRQKLLDANHPDIAHCNQIIATCFLNKYKYEDALPYLMKAKKIREDANDPYNPDLIRIYNNLSIIYFENGNTEEAKKYITKAYKGLNYDLNDPYNFDNINIPFMLTNPLETDMEAATYAYENNPTKKNFDYAIERANTADSLMNYMKYILDDPSSRMVFIEKQKLLFDEIINFHNIDYKQQKKDKSLAEVFRLIEKSNNAMMYEKIASKNSSSQLGMPESILDKKYAIEDSIAHYEDLLSDISNGENPDITSKLVSHKSAYNNLLDEIKKEYPKYFNAIYEYPIVSLDDYKKVLDAKETSITFYQGNRYSHALTVSNESANIYNLGESEYITNLLDEFIAALYDRSDIGKYNQVASQLYNAIIAPLHLDQGNNLTIITDGLYGLIPFELLRDNEESPYLFEDHTISYQYSATLRSESKKITSSNSHVLAMAPVFESEKTALFASLIEENDVYRSSMSELKESENELKSISDLYSGTYLLKSEATEENFKKLAPQSSLLHMATHGYVNHDNPDKSRLYFYSDSSSTEDGILNAYEIINLDLSNTELVTLSACNTGVGVIRQGEGVASLGRAFAYAGCKNQLISLWPANDKSTTNLMASYYSNLNEGQGKARALKNAKLSYLAQSPEILQHPYYWAGFVYYGDDTPLVLSASFGKDWMIYLGGICLLLFVVSLIFYKFRATK